MQKKRIAIGYDIGETEVVKGLFNCAYFHTTNDANAQQTRETK